MYVNRLLLGPDRVVSSPSIDEILHALNDLDGGCSDTILAEGSDSTRYMSISTGNRGGPYLVYAQIGTRGYYQLIDKTKGPGVEVVDFPGGQEMDVSAVMLVNTGLAWLALKHFVVEGDLDRSLQWEKTKS